jgi:hypothetical protein
MARIPGKYEPINSRRSRSGHSKGYVTWGLPQEDPTYYTVQERDATIQLGTRTIADVQYAADEAAGGLVMLALGRR